MSCEPEVLLGESLEAEIKALESLNLAQLRQKWRETLPKPLPKISSPEYVRRLLAWHMQARVYGGLSPKTLRRLRALARAFKNNPDYRPAGTFRLAPGTVVTRVWKGRRHDAMILEKGVHYEGTIYQSLSEVATQITGTRWSGPLFFGLRDHPTKR